MRNALRWSMLFGLGLPSTGLIAQAVPAAPWGPRAAHAQHTLIAKFWNERAGLFDSACPADPADVRFHYWWQAHTIDTLLDDFERSGDRGMLKRAAQVWAGVKRKNGGVTNDYYDDMLWMGLALQRLHAHTRDTTVRRDLDTLWQDVRAGWSEVQGGGIAWRKSRRDYKNTPANAPAVMLAVRRYRDSHDQSDLAFGKQVYDWLDANLVDPETGFVWDGKNRQGDGRTDKDWAFTYNQGARIGAAVELFRATKDRRYLDDAEKTFRAVTARMTNEDGVLREGGKGDGALFKGILVRYLGEFAAVDASAQAAVREFLQRQADSVWSHLERASREAEAPLLFAADWNQPPMSPVALGAELSGIMLFEQMAKFDPPAPNGGERRAR